MKLIVNYILLSVMVFLVACEDKNVEGDFVTTDIFPYVVTLEKQADKYGLWIDMIHQADLYETLNTFGQYTCFTPSNDAVSEYLGGKAIVSLSTEEARQLVMNHVFNKRITSVDFREGCVNDTNYIGDYLSVDFANMGLTEVILNKHSSIKVPDIELTNGVMHEVNKVLSVHDKTLKDYVDQAQNAKIFKQALTETGIFDALNENTVINEYGVKSRLYYTLLMIDDATLKQLGITDYESLKSRYSDSDDVTDGNNAFNRWVAYHVIKGAYFTNKMLDYNELADAVNMQSYLYGEGVQVKEERGNIQLNLAVSEEGVKSYTSIVKDQRNIPLKNGCVQYLDDYLDIKALEAVYMEWDPAVVKNSSSIPHYVVGHFGEYDNFTQDEIAKGAIEEWKWDTWPNEVPLQYTIYNSKGWFGAGAGLIFDIGNNDGGWLEVESPLIPPGSYEIYTYGRRWKGGGTYNIYIDGVLTAIEGNYYADGDIISIPRLAYGILFDKMEKHKIRIEYKEGRGGFMLGKIVFKPL
ncbi:fasciclin domain-containing protein [Saccharicrinis sp. GN24d3]|uniref:fasciclin domain-containing protein n=1 Tax=Saccharicrinis sp. GN24d3 TaxID=3458416 RepID=UPI00403618B9